MLCIVTKREAYVGEEGERDWCKLLLCDERKFFIWLCSLQIPSFLQIYSFLYNYKELCLIEIRCIEFFFSAWKCLVCNGWYKMKLFKFFFSTVGWYFLKTRTVSIIWIKPKSLPSNYNWIKRIELDIRKS